MLCAPAQTEKKNKKRDENVVPLLAKPFYPFHHQTFDCHEYKFLFGLASEFLCSCLFLFIIFGCCCLFLCRWVNSFLFFWFCFFLVGLIFTWNCHKRKCIRQTFSIFFTRSRMVVLQDSCCTIFCLFHQHHHFVAVFFSIFLLHSTQSTF